MSEEKKPYKNVSGQHYFFPEISRKCGPNQGDIVKFSDQELSKCEYLKKLIKDGKIIEVEEIEQEDSVVENILVDDNRIFENDKPPYQNNIIEFQGHQITVSSGNIPKTAKKIQTRKIEEKYDDIFSFDNKVGKKNRPQQQSEVESFFEEINEKTNEIKIKNKFGIWWCGPANDSSGYGKMSREMPKRIQSAGIDVQLDLYPIPDSRSKVRLTPDLEKMLGNKVLDSCPSIWNIMPPKFPHRSGRKIYYTMIETFGIPKTFLEKCKFADEIWLPSKFNVDLFESAKIGPTIKHMPLGVDENLYKPMILTSDQKSKFNMKKLNPFVFVSVFGWSPRKGNDILFRSYLQEFTKDDDVTLMVVSRYWGSTAIENIKKIRDDMANFIKMYCPNPANHPHIVHIGQAIAEDDMPLLYNMADAFVCPTRGEGFFLPGLEAGACELPVITTRCGGQLDYLNDDNAFLIDIEGYGKGSQEIREISSYYENEPFAVLGNKATEQTREFMRYVYEHSSKAKEKGKKLKKDILKNFTWDIVSQKLVDRIKEIS